MADAFVQIPMKQLVDLVINSPEEGVINFNLMHALFHVFVKQLNAQDVNVELHGETAEKVQNCLKLESKATPLNVTEIGLSGGKKEAGTDTVFVVDNIESTHSNVGVAVTKKQMDELYREIEGIKLRIVDLAEIPANLGIIESVRSENTPVIDVLQLLSLSKRIDAAEEGMNKLGSIVEDLIKSPIGMAKSTTCSSVRTRSKKSLGSGKKGDEDNEVIQNLIDDVENIKKLVAEFLGPSATEAMMELGMEVQPVSSGNFDGEETTKSEHKPHVDRKDSFGRLQRDVAELKERIFGKKSKGGSDADKDFPPGVQIAVLENKFQEMVAYMEKLDQNFNDDLSKLHNQFTDIEQDFNGILSKFTGGLQAGDASLEEPNRCCAAVYNKMCKLQIDLDQLNDASAKLFEDKDDKQRKLDEMLEQIEFLKTGKADKEDIDEALADKADACAVHRKVSHDQFDTACDELTRGIEDALNKLAEQELLWQRALDEIQAEIANKLDKMDLGPLREFINNKLKMLQDKMRSLAALKKEQEAAGTKSKFLKDVNCISCDKDVVMRKEMDSTLKPPARAVPPSRSMAPYLAYELDALRKQQKGLPGSKNLNHYESALAQKNAKKGGEDHVCNRYCGGSHTVTTPQQRVTRLGHFLMQWGPEAMPSAESKMVEPETKVAARQSVVVQGDIVSARRSSLPATKPRGSSKEAIKESKTSITRQGSAKISSKESLEKKVPSVADAKKSSQASVKSGSKTIQKSHSSIKDKIGSGIVEETAAEIQAEEGAPVEGEEGEAAPRASEGEGAPGEAPAEGLEAGTEAEAPEEGDAPPAEPPAEAPDE